MTTRSAIHLPALAKWSLALAVFATASGIAFAGWVDHGGQIFMAMIDSGLSWCF